MAFSPWRTSSPLVQGGLRHDAGISIHIRSAELAAMLFVQDAEAQRPGTSFDRGIWVCAPPLRSESPPLAQWHCLSHLEWQASGFRVPGAAH